MKTRAHLPRCGVGPAYTDFCQRVNRCIPWFPKN